MTIQLKEYLDETGHSPFSSWFRGLNMQAAAKVVTALYRLGQGNFSNVESVGAGVLVPVFLSISYISGPVTGFISVKRRNI